MGEERLGPPRSGVVEKPDASPGPRDTSTDLPASPNVPFGGNLEPSLRRSCDHRLSAIRWFRTDWQRGGALTGYATYRDEQDVEQSVVVKLPVPPTELRWLRRLQGHDVVPTLYASGEAVNGYDFAWVIMERLPHGPLGPAWHGNEFDLLVDVAARFHAAASNYDIDQPGRQKDWHAILKQARDAVQRNHLPQTQQWKEALKKANRKLDKWIEVWEQRPINQWCHGDLHLANALTRREPPQGPALLIDLAQVHAGHWIEDALYFEHLYWPHRDHLNGRKLCSMIARQRRNLGLTVEDDWARLASVRRALLAMSTPAALSQQPEYQLIPAALEVLEIEAG